MFSLESLKSVIKGSSLTEVLHLRNAYEVLTGVVWDNVEEEEKAFLKQKLVETEKGAISIILGKHGSAVDAIGSITDLNSATTVKDQLTKMASKAIDENVEQPLINQLGKLIDMVTDKITELTGAITSKVEAAVTGETQAEQPAQEAASENVQATPTSENPTPADTVASPANATVAEGTQTQQ